MCLSLSERYPVLKRLVVLQQIIKWIALFEGVLGIISISVKVILLTLKYESLQKSGSDPAAARDQLTKIVVLSVFVIQVIFALMLYEGARKKVLCLIKAWLMYTFLHLLIPMTMMFSNIFLLRNHKVPVMVWTMLFQIVLAIFHGIEATFVISFHKKTETDLRKGTLFSVEYHKNSDISMGVHGRKASSDASYSVTIDVESFDGEANSAEIENTKFNVDNV